MKGSSRRRTRALKLFGACQVGGKGVSGGLCKSQAQEPVGDGGRQTINVRHPFGLEVSENVTQKCRADAPLPRSRASGTTASERNSAAEP